MKKMLLATFILTVIFMLSGCGSGASSGPVTFEARIISDPVYDGDIEQTSQTSFIVTQGMSGNVQAVFAGIDPVTLTEFRAFLDFPLRGSGGVPPDAIIDSAFLDIFITSIQPLTGSIPMRVELVSFQPPTLLASDFSRTLQPPLTFITIAPPISQADVGRHVLIDVTPLMVEAQRRGLYDFQVRILEDFGIVSPGLIEINDTTGANRTVIAPLLQVTYF